MDLNKEIRETIEFYCGGTYENRKLAADKILQICKNKQLTIHSVSKSFYCMCEDQVTRDPFCEMAQCDHCKELESKQ